jgi:hypothetical protein
MKQSDLGKSLDPNADGREESMLHARVLLARGNMLIEGNGIVDSRQYVQTVLGILASRQVQ